ncbi:MAG: ABC transporter permease [Bacteriovoracaceae bacterium]|nr:ABC transporter permease [Bacteriovoracaceae bacterium]
MKNVSNSLFKVLLTEKSSFKFAAGVVLGLGFSIAVILCTIGIMDGFVKTLKRSLNTSTGDIIFYSRDGFFEVNDKIKREFEVLGIQDYSSLVQTEAFMLYEGQSKGVLIKGVNPETYNKVAGMKVFPKDNEIILGTELLTNFGLKPGDEVVVAMAGGNKDVQGLPSLYPFIVKGTVKHGIYQKDQRQAYVNLERIQQILGLDNKVNLVSLNVPKEKLPDDQDSEFFTDKVEDYQLRLFDRLGFGYIVKPFWHEFSTLIEAVEVEKTMIGLILQLVVVISIFNVLAFVIFLNERKSRELFLFKALGMSQGRMNRMWLGMISLIWVLSCGLSIVFVQIVDWIVGNASLFELPGDVYYLGRLSIILSQWDYLLVFSITYIWLFMMAAFGLFKIKKQSILKGLRKEFA